MEHVAIDLGGKESQICIRSASGEILEERRWPTHQLGHYLRIRPRSRVVMETSSEAFAVADIARAAGHEVVVMPSMFTPVFTAGTPRVKNDVIDARGLSRASVALETLPSVHICSADSREAKSLCSSRELLVGQRTQLCNRVRAFLRTRLQNRVRATSKTLATRVLGLFGDDCPRHLELILEQLDHLNEAIDELDAELRTRLEATQDCKRLATIPGVGPVTAVRFAAAIDGHERFPSGDKVASYFGLTPGENTTGFNTRRTSITKAGSPAVRRALVQAAWCLWRLRPEDPAVRWAIGVAERRGKKIAVVALAAKLVRIMFAMLRDQQPYDPKRSA